MDNPALQAPVMSSSTRFVRGKPRLLEEELPRILFLEDRSRLQALLATQIPQERLSNSSQHQLETEARMLPELCRLLDSVLTARDFLLEAGGEPARDLPAFLVTHHVNDRATENYPVAFMTDY